MPSRRGAMPVRRAQPSKRGPGSKRRLRRAMVSDYPGARAAAPFDTMFLALLLCLAIAPDGRPADVAGALAQLASPSSEERRLAQRWLSAHLTSTDYPALAEAALAGDAEVRGRIVHALAADERHLGLCALLSVERSPELAALGQRATTEMLVSWFDTAECDPTPRGEIDNELRGAFAGVDRLRVEDEPLEVTLERIARLADARREDTPRPVDVTLVLDPAWSEPAPARSRPAKPGPIDVQGGFDALVVAAARKAGAQIDLYGWDDDRPWMLVGALPSGEPRAGSECIVGWIRDVLVHADKPRGAASARALAALGWPAAIAWLEQRWSTHNDAGALQGLVVAAGRGRVAPALIRADSVRALLALADSQRTQADPASQRRADETIRALLAIGGIGHGGDDLAAVASEGWREAVAARRVNRMAIFAMLGRAPLEVRTALRAQLAARIRPDAPRAEIDERLAALRVLAATAGADEPPCALADPVVLLRAASVRNQAREFLGWCWRLDVPIATEWLTPDLDPQAREALLAHWLEKGGKSELERAVQMIVDGLAQPDMELSRGELLRRAAQDGARVSVESALRQARESAGSKRALAIDRLAVHAGVLAPDRAAALIEALTAQPRWSAADWVVAGALLARPEAPVGPDFLVNPEDALQRLFLERLRAVVAELQAAPPASPPADLAGLEAGWVRGAERAVVDLRARGDDTGAKLMLQRLRVALQSCQHPVRRELFFGHWPAASRASRDLASLEPWLGS